jgi:hypothetical protein
LKTLKQFFESIHRGRKRKVNHFRASLFIRVTALLANVDQYWRLPKQKPWSTLSAIHQKLIRGLPVRQRHRATIHVSALLPIDSLRKC